MGIHNLDRMFSPKSIAVIGAHQKPDSIVDVMMRNLKEGGFGGEIFPVNPHRSQIMGYNAFSSVDAIPSPVDLGIIATDIADAPGIVESCGTAGMGGVVIVSAGGKETGAKGREIETAIRQKAEAFGLRVIGPNCIGIINSRTFLNASLSHRMPIPGKTAFISQSGAICSSILDLSTTDQIGFSHVVSLGSMLDVDFGDVIDYLGSDPYVGSIVMYVECLSHFRYFMSAARAVSRVKPIIALKSGRTQSGAIAAACHTGAVAGVDAIYDAAFKRAGIVRVKTFEELFDCSELLAKQPPPAGAGLAIITNAGGPGVMAVDMLQDYGQAPAVLSSETFQKLDQVLPAYWSRSNPVDIMGDASPERYLKAVDICLNAPEVNGVLVLFSPLAMSEPVRIAASLSAYLQDKPKSVITSWMGGESVKPARLIFNRASIPTFDTPERAVRAFMDLYRYARNIEVLQEIPPKFHRRLEFNRDKARSLVEAHIQSCCHEMTEIESKDLLAAYGIPVNPALFAASEDEAVQKAIETGFPLALKIFPSAISHKSDPNGIHLNIQNPLEVRLAFQNLMASAKSFHPLPGIQGITHQPMLNLPHHELKISAKKDPDFGPVLMFGTGGDMFDVFKDHAFALPPINRHLARILIEETQISKLLKGFRNLPSARIELLEEILMRVSQLVTDIEHIEELDINPLFLGDTWASAVDARVIVGPSSTPSPLHLVISPYPNEFEKKVFREGFGELLIRPIRPEDAPLLLSLYESLSPRSIYMRFFTPLRSFQNSMLVRFTQIDYDREIALVAIQEIEGEEKMLGVARVILDIKPRHGEFSVIVSDACQGKGIGAELLSQCLSIAKGRGVESVMGVVLTENTQMLTLGRKLGFKIARVPCTSEYELTINLKDAAKITV
ncbi:MAG: bifunctional acetate--CoA ligase family protein/GNAT family N-acetyltransferase [Deltaproteobacteria bacterium]|nr:bifunctional acetate--CoA ligase family protein/GNAT family N-acetyltransferase [Deltaproteobacteria bacterium]